MNIFNKILNKETSIAIIGLGYVGLPLAVAFAKKTKVIGFDVDANKLEKLQQGIDPNGELDNSVFQETDLVFTDNEQLLADASFYIITVPHPH